MTTTKIPEVYTALANVLSNLSVEKNGVLPGNMGGKPYITAVDVAAEVKRLFVANNLIFLPDEKVVHQETRESNNRLQLIITITGSYTIVSTVDGSNVVISGTGDGLSTGTAVAANIASTNALKNALLRAFLITEQSVEDAGRNEAAPGQAPAQNAAQRKVETARAVAKPVDGELNALKAKVREAIEAGTKTREEVVALQNQLKESTKKTGLDLQRELVSALGL